MRMFLPSLSIAVSTLLCFPAAAMESAQYEKLTKQTIQELAGGKIADVGETLGRLQQAQAIGVAGCKEYLAKNPADAPLISKAVSEASSMMKMSAEALEEAWGDEGTAGDSVGRPLKAVDTIGVTRGFIDLVVHPARAHGLIVEFGKSHDPHALEEAKGELVEVLEHLKVAGAAL